MSTPLVFPMRSDNCHIVVAPPQDARCCTACERVASFLVVRLEGTRQHVRCIPCDNARGVTP